MEQSPTADRDDVMIEPEEKKKKREATVDRPSRERRVVERYSALSPNKVSATKTTPSFEQGSGAKLKDIPNVLFKLSKRKGDENLQALHTVMFGRKTKAHNLKKNIFQFSGFVWSENEEKMRTKVKEKLEKYNKDKLLDFCEMLDIQVRSSTKKEEVSAKLLEFLESPHATRDVLLAEKVKKGKKKRKRKTKGTTQSTEASSDKGTKKRKKNPETEVKKGRKRSVEAEEEDEDDGGGGSPETKDASTDENNGESEEESENVKSDEDNEEDEPEKPLVSEEESEEQQTEKSPMSKVEEVSSPGKKETAKSGKSPSKPVSKRASLPPEGEPKAVVDSKQKSLKKQTSKGSKAVKEKADAVSKEDKKKSSGKSAADNKKGQSHAKASLHDKKSSTKKEGKSASKVSAKEQGKSKANTGPSTEELHSVTSRILKEVDFNTVTLADILKRLGAHFDRDLMDRKGEVKSIIEEVINNMTDDENGEEEADAGDNEEEGNATEEKLDGDDK